MVAVAAHFLNMPQILWYNFRLSRLGVPIPRAQPLPNSENAPELFFGRILLQKDFYWIYRD